MARTLHCCGDGYMGAVAKVVTLNESPDHPGVTVRFTDLSSAVLMVAYLFKGRCRCGFRVFSEEESKAYHAERVALTLGANI